MLDTVAHNHFMQFQGKLVYWKWQKKTILDLILTHFGSNSVPKKISCRFYFYLMLYIVASYHCMQLQGKLIYQTWKNGENKLVLGPI